MRKLILLPILAFALACSDRSPSEPALASSPEMGLARAASGIGHVVKMVPLKGHADYGVTGADYASCDGIDGNAAVFITGEGKLTHLGRTQFSWTNCWAPSDESPWPFWPYELVSTRGTSVAANGDLLHWYGSVPAMEVTFPTPTFFAIGPLQFTGGTGRFANVQGEFYWTGTASDDLATGSADFDGVISSVGSSK